MSGAALKMGFGSTSEMAAGGWMVNPCHVMSLTPARPRRNRRDSRASGRCVSLRIPGRESEPISVWPKP